MKDEPEIKLPADRELVGRVLRAIASKRVRVRGWYLWSRVSDVFALGSTYSMALCREHGLDPDMKVGR